jgi:hypothetical protein
MPHANFGSAVRHFPDAEILSEVESHGRQGWIKGLKSGEFSCLKMPRFVSGHDFSRAEDSAKNSGFSPCSGKTCEKSGSRAILRGVQGLKALMHLTVCGTTEVVP